MIVLRRILGVMTAGKSWILLLFVLFCSLAAHSQQESDTSRTKKLVNRIRENKATQQLMRNFTRRRQDTLFNVKSEDQYEKYEGKIIRKIIVEHIGFERNMLDTSRSIRSVISRTANRLHNQSKEWVIRDNLFIRAGKPLNSYRVADNERYLRDLDFILDSRIFVRPIHGTKDSVDLLVVTRDVFSLGASFNPSSTTKYKFSVQDANLAGMGQRLQFTSVFDAARTPKFGYEWLYRKNNAFGTFINATLDYTLIGGVSNYGTENESSYYLQLSRPLYMPYTRVAGGVTLSKNKSVNVYNKPDSVFGRYRYDIQDYWIGYSFGHKKKLAEIRENRNRKFIAVRGFQEHYSETPSIKLNSYDYLLFNNRTSVLTQLTFFRQDYYKTRYVLGFGRTEDVPYGYRASFTAGWEKEQGRQRPYAGAEVYRNIVNKNGSFYIYTLKLASFYKSGRSEDALLSINLTNFSQIYRFKKSKIRYQLDLGYARQFNQIEKRPLDINDVNGLTRFSADSLLGSQRLVGRAEVIVFTPWSLIGFRIAPIARVELAYLSQPKATFFTNQNFYTALSTGFRVRNENLIFNTIEARAIFYPRTVEGISPLAFNIQANLRIKYPTILVSAPATVYN
jgi:hypothetical protein